MTSFFKNMLQDCYGLFYWQFNSDGQLIVHSINDNYVNDVLSLFINHQLIIDIIQQSHALPFIYEDQEDIFWIVCPNTNSHTIDIYGPIAIGVNQLHYITAQLSTSTPITSNPKDLILLLKTFRVIPLNQLFAISRECFYQLNQQVVDRNQIVILSAPSSRSKGKERSHHLAPHQGAYYAENAIFDCVKQGNLNYQSILNDSSAVSNGVHIAMGTLRQAQLSILTLNFICSRAAMAGGVSPSIIYTLADQYTEQCMNNQDRSALQSLGATLISDYATRVHQQKNRQLSLTPPIAACKEFIDLNVHNKISLDSLTTVSGYSYYYLSHEFNRQLGCSINKYINQAKVQSAKRLLKTSQLSASEIAAELHFSSASYFSKIFRNFTRMTPVTYRLKHRNN